MEPIMITPKHVNDRHYESADCNLFTPAFGIYAAGNGDFGWWTATVFAWNAETLSYVCVAKDSVIGNGCAKQPVIPKNGFVLMDCGSEYKDALAELAVGGQAFLYADGRIALHAPIEDAEQIRPDFAKEQLPAPSFVGGKPAPDGNGVIRWEAVERASGYTVSVTSSIANPIGSLLTEPQVVTEPCLALDPDSLVTGYSYTVTVTAFGDGLTDSLPCIGTFRKLAPGAENCKLKNKKVVAFGDSLTARPGWVGMLEGYIGCPVINSGVGGDTTVHGMARFQKDVLDHKPDVVLICFGPNDQAAVIKNDYAPNIPLETYRQNMIHFICQCQKLGAKVILITPHDPCAAEGFYVPGAYGLDYAHGNLKDNCAVLRTLAKEYGCGLIDINAQTEGMDGTQIVTPGDGLHQSMAGHVLWARIIGQYLIDHQAKLTRTSLPIPQDKKSKMTVGAVAGVAAMGAAVLCLLLRRKKK